MLDYLKDLQKSFSINTLLGSLFFFFILASWYTLRPLRNELAVQDIDNISILLAMVGVTMLVVNYVYSWVASLTNIRWLLVLCYIFLGSNLLIFMSLDFNSSPWIGRSFYVWCNIYSFFVVAIFWVVMINLFRGEQSTYSFGLISLGGTLGAAFGSRLAKLISATFDGSNIDIYAFATVVLLIIGLLVGLITINRIRSVAKSPIGGSASDAFRNLANSKQIQSIAIYMYLFTGLMTIHWITSAQIFANWTDDSSKRIALFADMELAVSLLAGFTQIFLTSFFLRKLGIKIILFSYGVIFAIVFIVYASAPLVVSAIVITIFLRVFEYAINKPAREVIYTHLKRTQRYKSSVLVDTFFARFGDFSGSIFLNLFKNFAVTFNFVPLLSIPFVALISFVGIKVSKIQSEDTKKGIRID